MPRYTLTFSLPEEEWEHRMALNGHRYYRILREVDESLRNKVKHGGEAEAYWANLARNHLHEYLKDEGVDLFD